MNENSQTIGERVRNARLAKRMSQAELARLSGVSQQTVAKIENDQTQSSRHLSKFARALGLPLSELDPEAADIFVPELESSERHYTQGSMPVGSAIRPASTGPHSREIPFYALQLLNGLQVWPDSGAMATWQRIDILAGSESAYALYVASREASPAVDAGDVILVNPDRPALVGTDCVFLPPPGAPAPRAVLIRRIKDITPTHWVVEQFNPHEISEIAAEENLLAHRIVAVIRRA